MQCSALRDLRCEGTLARGVSVTERIRVALAQIRPLLGEVSANLDKHLEWIETARAKEAELVVFPELGVTGYQVQDLTLDVARPLHHPQIQRLVRASTNVDVVFSFVEESESHLFYVTAVYASGGEVAGVHRKVYLPTYGMFDEGRYFAHGDGFRTFSTRFGRVGIMICEDAWHPSSPNLLALGGADLVILPSNSPARSVTDSRHFGSQAFWRQLVQTYAQIFGFNLAFVNRTGFEDGVNFFGGSVAVSAAGEFLAEAPKIEEALVFAEFDPSAVRRARYLSAVLRDERPEFVRRELSRLIRRNEEDGL
ncbi:nitrilase-related carbon-nitrogen hydrolase [Alicyclobacillus sp. ALC3]|uniref:nitrilase-related carbon-nitrogen hydrolase n=1 Tax=Alicyclobacillus sp. ALC3 TaxID=2796143 RepID=UPI002379F45A|nr:nitrilase-related carbon-nitrogen hydrolase [Alicyclobacillus sp. ALC3]